MRQVTTALTVLLFGMWTAAGCASTPSASGLASAESEASPPVPPVAAPAGHRWELNPLLSDEFDGDALDRTKWNDHYPGWEGRVPGRFVPEALTVAGGHLEIKSTVLDPPQGDDGEWTIQCGAIQSKTKAALYGYYETRVKASNVSTSTTFWLKNDRPAGVLPYKQTELDILESVGNAQRWPGFADHMMSNTHIEYFGTDTEAEPVNVKKGGRHPIGGRVSEAFHTFGCWWKSPTELRFYLDGEHVFTIHPDTTHDPAPFDQPMFLNAVCEIYDWEVAPTTEELLDDTRNTTRYDYIRAWRLVETE